VDRCPGCNKPVAEADTVCPHCSRDFSAPVARRNAPPSEPERSSAPPDETPVPDDDPPARAAAKAEPPSRAAKERPRLEEPDPPRDSDPVPAPSFEIDTPQAYSPGYASQEDSYQVKKKEPSRPAWHWIAMAVASVAAFAVFNPKGPKRPAPAEPAAPVAAPAPPPAAPVAVPGDVAGAAKALTDAKDAAAAANTAAAVPVSLGTVKPAAPPPTAPPKRQRRPAAPVEPAEDSSISIAPVADEEPQRRRGGASASDEWRMRGAIFDLLTAEPVKGADVVFMDAKTGRRFATGTDAQGRYRATLPYCEEGYDLAIRHGRYEPKYFEDGVPSYRELAVEQRTSAAADLLRILQTKEMIVGQGGSVIERNFVLIPLEQH
jgi:hypothetical protein